MDSKLGACLALIDNVCASLASSITFEVVVQWHACITVVRTRDARQAVYVCAVSNSLVVISFNKDAVGNQ